MPAAKQIIWAVFIAAVGAFIGGQADAQSPGLIVPGKSIGMATIGTLRTAIASRMGNPERAIAPPYPGSGGWRYDYPDLMVIFSAIPRDSVESIATSSPNFATREGIRVGSSGSDLIRVYGDNYKSTSIQGGQPLKDLQLCYIADGLGVWLTPNNVVRNIYVFVPGTPACGS